MCGIGAALVHVGAELPLDWNDSNWGCQLTLIHAHSVISVLRLFGDVGVAAEQACLLGADSLQAVTSCLTLCLGVWLAARV